MSRPTWMDIARRFVGTREVVSSFAGENGLRNSKLWTHLVGVDAVPDHRFRHAVELLRLLKRDLCSKNGELKGVPLVVVLVRPLYPPAVVGRVITVVVDAVKLVFCGWSFTHISNKARESAALPIPVNPSVTDLDAPPSVVLVAPPSGVEASTFHINPNALRRGVGHSVRSDFWALFPAHLRVLAGPAHRRFTGAEVVGEGPSGLATSAPQKHVTAIFPGNCPFAKYKVLHDV